MRKAISRVLFWTYPRGSWQYDLLCIMILSFIFFTPTWIFDRPEESAVVSALKESSSPKASGVPSLDRRPADEFAEEKKQLPRMTRSGP